MARPERLFRYFSPKASDLFKDQKLWFAAVKDFNDPFDVAPRHDNAADGMATEAIKKAYAFLPPEVVMPFNWYEKQMEPFKKRLVAETARKRPMDFQAAFSERYGIVCFCEYVSSLLMWAHYADSHRGSVVEFDPRHPLFLPQALGEVQYSRARPFLEAPDYRKILLTKSTEWEYEVEHRLIVELRQLKLGRRRDGTEKHFKELPKDAVKAVYLGCRIPPKVRDEIATSLRIPSAKHIKLFEMRLHPTDYRLEPGEIDPATAATSAPPG